MSIEDLCVGELVFINTKDGDDTPGALGGDPDPWGKDTGDPLDCRRDTPGANEIRKYDVRGVRFAHQFFFAAVNHDLSAVRDNPQAHRIHWVETRNGSTINRYLRVLSCYMEDTPSDDPEMEMWIVDASEETTRNDSAEVEAT